VKMRVVLHCVTKVIWVVGFSFRYRCGRGFTLVILHLL